MNASNDIEGNPSRTDWHPADVLAALKKRGQSLAGLSVANGYHPTAAGKALKQPWPALELLVAQAIGLTPQVIWPSRYERGTAPYRARGRDGARGQAANSAGARLSRLVAGRFCAASGGKARRRLCRRPSAAQSGQR